MSPFGYVFFFFAAITDETNDAPAKIRPAPPMPEKCGQGSGGTDHGRRFK